MKNLMRKSLLVVFTTILIVACAKVPLTNRKQMNLLPESQLIASSLTTYSEFLASNPVVSGSQANTQLVKSVGSKISNAVIRYMQQNKYADRIKGYQWEFNLVESKEINAWCLPGGKVVVYSGLLPITKDETGLAFVIGHEIAHAVARHGNERMSQMVLAETGGVVLDAYLTSKPQQTKEWLMTAYGAGAQVGVMLPFSRMHESEADKLGMIFMAMAGYDPAQAVEVWNRMIKANKGPKPPELLSTHPADNNRINDIRKFVPSAMKYYKK
ncbi:MAG: M48 family metallopeptidase [Bacteroidetes bacterium]|nr:M48 family metallopeptidase [Bacteroidota bacterium]